MSYHVASCKQAGWHIRPPWAREQGLALVEVVVASLILGIAVAGARSVGLGPTLLAPAAKSPSVAVTGISAK